MEHRSMGRSAATEMMTLHKAGKSASFAGSDDVNQLVLSEDVNHHLVAGIGAIAVLHCHLTDKLHGSNVGFLEMSVHRPVHSFGFDELHEAELHRVVAILRLRLLLNHNAGTGLNDSHGDDRPIIVKKLGHSDFFTQYSVNHRSPISYFACSRPNALISTSTPAGRSSFISASTVWGVGSRISSSLLWVRISNCSRDFLSTCGDRKTVNLLMTVGRGIGPATRAPVLFAVSTISVAD